MVTSKSKSPTVSFPLRRDPAGVTLSTILPAFSICSAISAAALSTVLIRNLPDPFLNVSTALRMFCSLFSPNPARSRSFPSRANFSTSVTVAHWNFFHKNKTFFGPSDCKLSNSKMVAGYFLSIFRRRA